MRSVSEDRRILTEVSGWTALALVVLHSDSVELNQLEWHVRSSIILSVVDRMLLASERPAKR
eukprot:scaffold4137_cov126-Skeletonema_dohrnii-CCMP3373.AAC.6